MLQVMRETTTELLSLPRDTVRGSFDEALRVYGLGRRDAAAAELIVRRGQTVVLHEALRPVLLETGDAARFKEWVGLADATIEQYPVEGLPELPRAAWAHTGVTDPGVLRPEEWEDVQRATKAYLFGHSALVAGYKEAIELYFGPFAADVYVLPRLRIEDGGTLIVRGHPAALLVEHLELCGGDIRFYTIVKMWVDSLRKESL